MLEVCRYVELNPVRAAMVAAPGDWPWSSYRAHVGQAAVPVWLGSQDLWGYLIGTNAESESNQARAQRAYAELVAAGHGVALWAERLNRQIYLGDDEFVGRMLDAALPGAKRSAPVPKVQRRSTLTLVDWLARCATREDALRCAHEESGLSMTAMAAELGVSGARVSQLIARAERQAGKSL